MVLPPALLIIGEVAALARTDLDALTASPAYEQEY